MSSVHARCGLMDVLTVRYALEKPHINCERDDRRVSGATGVAGRRGPARRSAQRISSHSTVVPSMRTKGKPTLVCHSCGELSTKLLSVSRLRAAQRRVSVAPGGRGSSDGSTHILVFWP